MDVLTKLKENNKIKDKNTFRSIDELLTIGTNRNVIYREEDYRRNKNIKNDRKKLIY